MAYETTFWKNERGAREFDVAGRRYRASWMRDNRRWFLSEVNLDGSQIACWERKSWDAVEDFVGWRHELETGNKIGPVTIGQIR